VDIDSKENLIANKYSVDEICKQIGADSLVYLDLDALTSITQGTDVTYCTGCFTDKYPIDVSGAAFGMLCGWGAVYVVCAIVRRRSRKRAEKNA